MPQEQVLAHEMDWRLCPQAAVYTGWVQRVAWHPSDGQQCYQNHTCLDVQNNVHTGATRK